MSDDTDNIVELPAPKFRVPSLDPEISAEWDAWADLRARWHKNQSERMAARGDDDGSLVDEETALVREMAMTPATRWQHIHFKIQVFQVSSENGANGGYDDKLLLASVEADLENRY